MIISTLHGLKRLHDKIFNPGLSSTPGLKMLHVIGPLTVQYFHMHICFTRERSLMLTDMKIGTDIARFFSITLTNKCLFLYIKLKDIAFNVCSNEFLNV